MRYLLIKILLLLGLLSSLPVMAVVHPAPLFCSNMVLQCDSPVPVWGTAAPGERISVTFAPQKKTTVADGHGKWSVTLAPLKADIHPRKMVIAGANTIICANVLVGEVWVASGQSNMTFPMDGKSGKVQNAAVEVAAANWPYLRLFQAPNAGAEKTPEDNNWQPCTPRTVKLYSALAYFYGRDLHTALNVPVGIINASLTGTAIAHWMPPNGSLYRKFIKPLIPFAMRGMIWYQGESDKGRLSYADDMRTLVTGLREAWRLDDFPFYYVQIAPAYDFPPASLPLLWQAQQAALAIPNTYMSTSADLGIDLHPRDKQTAAERLARIALARTYHRSSEEYSAPVFRHIKIGNRKIRVFFDHAAGLRATDDGPLTWFTIAGANHIFYPADAVIDGSTVLVSSTRVPKPVAVRYAWDNLAEPNMVNDAGLPAFPFRSDNWPVSTAEKAPFHARLTIPRGTAVTDLDAARSLLDSAATRTIQCGGRDYAHVAWAVGGESLLMRIQVHDSRVSPAQDDWEGAAVEIYLSPAGAKHVSQVVFSLHGPARKLTANRCDMGKIISGDVPGNWRVSQVNDGSYTLEAALPLSFFGITPWDDSFLLDASVTAAPFHGQKPATAWLFSPECANCNNTYFGQALLAKVSTGNNRQD